MRDWLLIFPGHGESLEHMARVEIQVFRSGGTVAPEPDDLKRAVHAFAARLDRGLLGERPSETDFEFVLVPLDGAKRVGAGLSFRYSISEIRSWEPPVSIP